MQNVMIFNEHGNPDVMNLDDGPRGVDMMDNLPASWMSAPDADSGRRNL